MDLRSDRLTCMIDALDESSEDEMRDLVEFLADLGTDTTTKHIDFRLCLSSRHVPYVEINSCQHLNLDRQDEHHRDITVYVNGKLKLGVGKIADETRIAVQERVQGVFLWAVLVVRILNKERDHGNVHKLQERLESIPDGLHNLFRDILARNADDEEHCILIMQWIAFARRPLSREELYFAVRGTLSECVVAHINPWDRGAIETLDMDLFILHASKGLAEIIDIGGLGQCEVRFIHESVRDYLYETGFNTLAPELSRNLVGLTHDRLKKCCYGWLSDVAHLLNAGSRLDLNPFERMVEIPGFPHDRLDGSRSIERFPFLEYSVHNVVHHAEQACRSGVAQTAFLEEFREPVWTKIDQYFHHRGLLDTQPDYIYIRVKPKEPIRYIRVKARPNDRLGSLHELVAGSSTTASILAHHGARRLLAAEFERATLRLSLSQFQCALNTASHQVDPDIFTMVLEKARTSGSLVSDAVSSSTDAALFITGYGCRNTVWRMLAKLAIHDDTIGKLLINTHCRTDVGGKIWVSTETFPSASTFSYPNDDCRSVVPGWASA